MYDGVRGHRARSIRAGAENGRKIVRILIAANRADTRRALKNLLQSSLELDVVAEASRVGDMLALAEATHPDVVLLDWDLLDCSAATCIDAVRRLETQPKVIVLGLSPESEQASTRADAFVSKRDAPRQLLIAMRGMQAAGDGH